MRIAVVGTGYVGLVTGTCFAESGNDVACIDIDRKKIENLRRNVLPIFEPGLGEMVERNQAAGRLTFTTELAEGIAGRGVVIIAVGTPQTPTGEADLATLWNVVEAIRQSADGPKIVVVKSTVPVGTNAEVARRLNQGELVHQTASNPEFLKEGFAVDDFMKPDRVVVGTHSAEAADALEELHAPFLLSGRQFMVMSPESAEMTKYASNCMLATKISFINEIANLCERLGADVADVRRAMGQDQRIGTQFLYPGCGYGGSCFPKDVAAMIALARKVGAQARVLEAVNQVNQAQKGVLFEKLQRLSGGELAGRTIAVWGLAFKPRTDDIREAPSLVLLSQLLEAGAGVRVYDPEAMDNVRRQFGDRLTYCTRAYEALEGADGLVVVTEWQEFRNPDFDRMKRLMRRPVVVDGRNLYDPVRMARRGFAYEGIGRAAVTGSAQ